MRRWVALILLAALSLWQAPSQAQGRTYSQAELDALLAPVALYPDPVLSHILDASTYPDDLREAAAWSRANSHLTGEDAVRAAEAMPWQPSVKALVAFPDLLARMDESPQWTVDLAAAFREQEPYVMDTVQALRRRAQASGYLQNTPQQQVYEQGDAISVYPSQPQMVYVPYYDPYVVYGPWWSPYRPVFWRPWFARPAVFVSTQFFVTSVDWRRRHIVRHVHRLHPHVHRVQPPLPVTIHNHAHPVRPIVDSTRISAQQPVHRQTQALRPIGVPVRPMGEPVRPIVDSVRIPQPAAQPRRSEPRRDVHPDRRVHASPPVLVRSPVQAVRPIVDSVRLQSSHQVRPSVESAHIRQPHHQQFPQFKQHHQQSRQFKQHHR